MEQDTNSFFSRPRRRTGLVAMRMRTKLLLCLLTVSFGLTALSLVVIRTSLQRHTRERLNSDLSNSLNTFQNLQAHRREMLRREEAPLAGLPNFETLVTLAYHR